MVDAGYVAVVDATFLLAAQRAPFSTLAAELGVPFVILDCDAPVEVLRQRILMRRQEAGNVSDADLAVLERQLVVREPLSDAELGYAIRVRPESDPPVAVLRQRLVR